MPKKEIWTPLPGPQTQALQSEADEVFFGGSAGGGKLLPLDLSIPTPQGWTTMGELKAGDYVYSEQGKPIKVLVAHPVEQNPESYRLTFDDGTEIDACADHKWFTYTGKEMETFSKRGHRKDIYLIKKRKETRTSKVSGNKSAKFTASLIARNQVRRVFVRKPQPTGGVRTTKEIFETLRSTKKQRANHAVPITKPLECREVLLPLDPYVLGAWLGDGSKQGGVFTGIDQEIWGEIEKAGFVVTHSEKTNDYGHLTGHYIRGLKVILRSMEVLMDKHIPSVYFRASKEQRLALLQGLMDTDGGIGGGKTGGKGSSEFQNTNRRIIDGVYELIVSLGWKATIRECRAKIGKKDYGVYWKIRWTPSEYVFRLPRKRNQQRLATRQTTRFRHVVDCKPIASKPMRCITVDNPTGLYLVSRAMIPTHNSDLLLGMAKNFSKAVIFRRVFPELFELIERSRAIYQDVGKYNGSGNFWRLDKGQILEFESLQYESDKYGQRGRPRAFYGFDEITEFSESSYRFVIAWNRTTIKGERCRIVCTGNPPTTSEGTWVKEYWGAWLDPKHPNPALPGELRFYTRIDDKDVEVPDGTPFEHNGELKIPKSRTFIPARLTDNPYLGDDYKARLQSLPEPMRSQLLYGDMTIGEKDADWQVIPTAWVYAAIERGKKGRPTIVDEYEKEIIQPMTAVGCDIAYGGSDNTCIVRQYGNWIGPIKKYPGRITDSGEKVVKLILEDYSDEAMIGMDTLGVGKAAWDALQSKNVPYLAVDFSRASVKRSKDKHYTFANLRAECYWKLMEDLDPNGDVQLALPDDPELVGDLTAQRYEIMAGGKIKIEDKKKIKERLGRSPDKGDALAVCTKASRKRKQPIGFYRI